MLARYGGGNSGISEYLENGIKNGRDFTREELDTRLILQGDLQVTESIIQSIEDKNQDRYLHITLSFRESEIPQEILENITGEYKELLTSAYDLSEFNFYAEAHLPKIKNITDKRTGQLVERKPHIHIVIPRTNLVSGKSLNPVGDYLKSTKYMEAIQEYINNKYKLESPKEFTRSDDFHHANILSRIKGDFFHEKNGAVKKELVEKIDTLNIHSRSDFITLLSKYGEIKERNAGTNKSYLAVKLLGDQKYTNLNHPVFSKDYIENRVIPVVRPTEKQIQARLSTWQNIASREIKHVHSASSKFREIYKNSTLPEREQLLIQRESDYDRKYGISAGNREQRANRFRELRSQGNESINRRQTFAQISRGLPKMPQRDVVSPIIERGNNGAKGTETLLHGHAINPVGNIETDLHSGMRRSFHDGRRLNHSANVVDQYKVSILNQIDMMSDADKFRIIRTTLEPDNFLNYLTHKYNIDKSNYRISFAKDGSARIGFDQYNLNVSDFLTKHLNLPWQEAKQVLVTCYDSQTSTVAYDERKIPDRKQWDKFNREQLQPLYMQVKVSREELRQAVKKMRSESNNIYRVQKNDLFSLKKPPKERKAEMSIIIFYKLQREELIREYAWEVRNSISGVLKQPDLIKFQNYLTKHEDSNMAFSDPLNKFKEKFENSITGDAQSVTIKDTVAELKNDSETRKKQADKLRMNDLIAQKDSSKGVVNYKSIKDGSIAFKDTGDRLVFAKPDADKISLGLDMAISKFGQELKLNGSAEFKKQVAELAAERGLQVIFKPEKFQEVYLAKVKELEAQKSGESEKSRDTEQSQEASISKPDQSILSSHSETKLLMQIVANQNKGTEIGMTAKQALDDLNNGKPEGVQQAMKVIDALNQYQNHPAVTAQVRKAESELGIVREAPVNATQAGQAEPVHNSVPVANVAETKLLMQIVANQNKGTEIGMTAKQALDDLNNGKPEGVQQATKVIDALNQYQNHPAVAAQVRKAESELGIVREAPVNATQAGQTEPTQKTVDEKPFEILNAELRITTKIAENNPSFDDISRYLHLESRFGSLIKDSSVTDKTGMAESHKLIDKFKELVSERAEPVNVSYKAVQGEPGNLHLLINKEPAEKVLAEQPHLLRTFEKNSYLSKFSTEQLLSGVIHESTRGEARAQVIDVVTGEGKTSAKTIENSSEKSSGIEMD